jgi:ribonuclease D
MYIDKTEALQAFVTEALAEAAGSYIAIDTEFVRERTYWPHLCLVQIATAKQAVLIDVLQVDVRLLTPLLSHPDIIKVFHAGRQDMEIFWHDLQMIPQPIFDTQIGAMFAGLGEGISYESLIHKLLEVRLDKTSQYTNWAQRPLTEQQQAYAVADVYYLYQAYPLLVQKLQDLGRQQWLCDEIAQLTDPQTYEANLATVWQRIHMPTGRGQNLAVLQDLAAWREQQAQALNYNRSRVIRDEHLACIAMRLPQSLDEIKELLEKMKDLKGDQDALAQSLYDVVSKSLIRLAPTWPQPITRKPTAVDNPYLLELLKLLQRTIADDLEIPMRLLIHKGDLEKLVNRNEQEPVPEEIGCLSGWRHDAFGRYVNQLLGGEIGLTMGQKGLTFKEVVKAVVIPNKL